MNFYLSIITAKAYVKKIMFLPWKTLTFIKSEKNIARHRYQINIRGRLSQTGIFFIALGEAHASRHDEGQFEGPLKPIETILMWYLGVSVGPLIGPHVTERSQSLRKHLTVVEFHGRNIILMVYGWFRYRVADPNLS